jgi:nucleoside-diphosphate-sugar epimerase
LGIGPPALEDVVTEASGPVRTILITGNMGYVGPAVVSHLRESVPDATLIGLDTGYFAHCLTGASPVPERALDRQYFGDVRTTPASLLEGVDAVVHLAAISNDPIGNAYDSVTVSVNHEATIRVARAAKAAGARAFVFASSCSIYGVSGDAVAAEDAPAQPLTPYARSKWLAERDLERLADDGFAVTSLRFATACGMSERLRLDLVLNDFVASALVAGRITILSDGTPWRPLIHVDDMARAIEWAVRRGGEAGSFVAVNVGSDEWNYRIRDLAEEVADAMSGVEVALAPTAAPDKRSYRVSFRRFRELAPGHQPQVGLGATVEGLVEGLSSMGFADPEFRSSNLVRLVVLQDLHERGLVNAQLKWVYGNGH